MSNEKIKALSAVLTAVFIVWLIVVSGWMNVAAVDVSGGGDITNQAPTVATGPTGTIVSKTNAETESELYTGTVKDTNDEMDIASVTFTSFGPGDTNGPIIFVNNTAAVTLTAILGSGVGVDMDGITVWNATPRDGILSFSARRTFNASCTEGTYYQWLNVTDGSAATASASETTVISSYTHVTWTVVFRNNTTYGAGIWAFSDSTQTVGPTSANVNSVNWLRARNDGNGEITSLSIQFSNFAAVTSIGTVTITLATGTNMKFKYAATTDLMNDTATFGDPVNGAISGASAGGTLAVGAYRYFEYQIIDVSPTNILPVATYSGTITASYS